MDTELKELKSVLRSLVVSSPSQVDVRSLLRDYRQMMGAPIPLAKFGFRDPLAFLRERFNDCFILHGPPSNPTLTLIVPETLKHIDKFVQKQKANPTVKFKGKRRSVPGTITQPPEEDLIVKTFQKYSIQNGNKSPNNNIPILKSVKEDSKSSCLVENSTKVRNVSQQIEASSRNCQARQSPEKDTNVSHNRHQAISPVLNKTSELTNDHTSQEEKSCSAVRNFLKKRTSLYNSQFLDGASSANDKLSSCDEDSGRQTSSSNSIKKSIALEELKHEVVELVAAHPDGVWCTDLLRLYRERNGRELKFGRFGFTSIISLVCTLDARLRISRPDDTGDWLLRPRQPAPAPAPAPASAPAPRPRSRACRSSTLACDVDPDDALPGIDFDPDVFPADCMHFMESIPAPALGELRPAALLDVMVGEVYSPSHFWLLRLGDHHHIAMERIMDEMTEYYSTGEGRERRLALGAVRAGHYCSSVFDRDWHRSLIVKVIDSDTVKVRHVDYGTVDRVPVSGLKPLLRRWGQLPAQAVRARLAGVRPGAGGRRWPHAAAARFLDKVRDAKLVASVVAVDHEEDILEVFLVNTSTATDECVSAELVRSGHADPRPDSCLRTDECYLFPRFGALESGATPNFAEISDYLRHGIALDFVDDYRRHVPSCLPPAAPLAAAPTPPPPEPEPEPEAAPSPPRSPPPSPPPSPKAACLVERATSPPPPRRVERGVSPLRAAESGVTLSAGECDTFAFLSRVDPAAAHWFMVGALGRAGSQLDVAAPEFRPGAPPFRPNVAAAEFRPRYAPQRYQCPVPQMPQVPPQFAPRMHFVPHTAYGPFTPPAGFMPPPGYGPC